MQIVKATPQEQKEYAEAHTGPGAPPHLYGWAVSKKRTPSRLPIEYLGEGPGEPNYEVFAPDGTSWLSLHSQLATTLADLKETLRGDYWPSPCDDDCDCKPKPENQG